MTLTQVIPVIESLPHADKLMKLILSQLAQEKGVPLETQNSAAAREKEALWDIVGMAEGKDAKITCHHDKYLYGAE